MVPVVQQYMYSTVYGPDSTEIYVQFYICSRVVQKYMYSTVYGPGDTEICVQYCMWPG